MQYYTLVDKSTNYYLTFHKINIIIILLLMQLRTTNNKISWGASIIRTLLHGFKNNLYIYGNF